MPNFIQQLVTPTAKASQGRKSWGIDLESVWIPFFTATNAQGDTAIPAEALGQPLRLATAKDGAIRFGSNGQPVIKVASDISAQVKIVRENFTASLLNYAQGVAKDNPKGLKAEIARCSEAGKPVAEREQGLLNDAMAKRREAELAEAIKQAESQPKAEAEAEKELAGVAS